MSTSTNNSLKSTKRPSVTSTTAQSQQQTGVPKFLTRYNKLPTKWKIYLGLTTFVAAYMADSIGTKIMEGNMIDYEANRRVELELAKESTMKE